MKKKFDNVYQFKITLEGIKPPIWRRIQVPGTYSFWDLHVAVQDAMGWQDCHLHAFDVVDPSTGARARFGIPVGGPVDIEEALPGWEHYISDFFSTENPSAGYEYDFGDGWTHKVELEKILPRQRNVGYPRCTAGKRACPPEDCGGPWRYWEFLEAVKDPGHEEHESMMERIGGEFDPEDFDPEDVEFDDPDKRWKTAFG